MSTILQFRCTNEDCVGNYQFTSIAQQLETALLQSGALGNSNATSKCRICGNPGVVDVKPISCSKKHIAEHNAMLEDTIAKLRQTVVLAKDIAGQKKLTAGGVE